MSDEPEIAHVYLQTDVSICDIDGWISGFEFAGRLHASVHVLTAWNPGKDRPGDVINREQNQALRLRIEAMGHSPFSAIGRDPNSDHAEESWAVVGLTDQEAIALGRAFGQVAVFRISGSRQTVLGCVDEWELSRGSLAPLGFDGARQWINDPDKRTHLQTLLDRYFGKPPEYQGFRGREFEWFVARSTQDAFTPWDMMAVSALSVEVPAPTARFLIQDAEARFAHLLKHCIEDVDKHRGEDADEWLWRADGPFDQLFGALSSRELPGVGKVVRSKLLAAKFPDLVPIRDSRVERILEWVGQKAWWEPMHRLLSDTRESLTHLVVADEELRVSPLRKLDVLLWMEARDRGF